MPPLLFSDLELQLLLEKLQHSARHSPEFNTGLFYVKNPALSLDLNGRSNHSI
jgi:hypothetical protein